MELSDTLQALYTATVEQEGGTYQITVPEREIATGTLSEGETYRVALISTSASDSEATDTTGVTQSANHADHQQEYDGPPVEEGEQRDVEIENLGDQGDGIAKVERGYVVIVPKRASETASPSRCNRYAKTLPSRMSSIATLAKRSRTR